MFWVCQKSWAIWSVRNTAQNRLCLCVWFSIAATVFQDNNTFGFCICIWCPSLILSRAVGYDQKWSLTTRVETRSSATRSKQDRSSRSLRCDCGTLALYRSPQYTSHCFKHKIELGGTLLQPHNVYDLFGRVRWKNTHTQADTHINRCRQVGPERQTGKLIDEQAADKNTNTEICTQTQHRHFSAHTDTERVKETHTV